MKLTSLTVCTMRSTIAHCLAVARGNRTDDTSAFLYELHQRGFVVVPRTDAEFEEVKPQQDPNT